MNRRSDSGPIQGTARPRFVSSLPEDGGHLTCILVVPEVKIVRYTAARRSMRTAAPASLSGPSPEQRVRWAELHAQVQVWLTQLDHPPGLVEPCADLLSESARMRIERYRTAELRSRHTVAAAALIDLIRLYTGTPAEQINLTKSDVGEAEAQRRVCKPRNFSSAWRTPEISPLMRSQPIDRSVWTSKRSPPPPPRTCCATALASMNENGFRLYLLLGDARCFISCGRSKKRT